MIHKRVVTGLPREHPFFITRLTPYNNNYDLQNKYPARLGRIGVDDALFACIHFN
jgi:hypothetical protein